MQQNAAQSALIALLCMHYVKHLGVCQKGDE